MYHIKHIIKRNVIAINNSPVVESSGGCDVGQVVGGTVGGAILVAFVVATAVIMLFKYRKEKTRNGLYILDYLRHFFYRHISIQPS